MPLLRRFSLGGLTAGVVLGAGLVSVGLIVAVGIGVDDGGRPQPVGNILTAAIAARPETAPAVCDAAAQGQQLAAVCWVGAEGDIKHAASRTSSPELCDHLDDVPPSSRFTIDTAQPWLGEVVLVQTEARPFPLALVLAAGAALLFTLLLAGWSRRLVARRVDALAVSAHRVRTAPVSALLEAEAGELQAVVIDVNAALDDLRQQRQDAATERDRATSRLRAAEGRLQAFIANAEDAILTADADGIIDSFNRSAERLFGRAADRVVGTSAGALLPRMFGADAEEAPRESKIEVGAGLETVARRVDGTEFPVECSVSLMQTGDVHRLVWIVRDMTERKLQEQNLEQIRAHLEQKVVDRIAALSRTNKQLQSEVAERRRAEQAALAAARAKSEFLANMSHELRTPLNAIIGYSELISETAEEEGITVFSKDLARIQIAAQHLLSLIRDILELSSIEAGEQAARWEDFAVSDLVEQLTSSARPRAEARGNNLNTVVGRGVGSLRSDPDKLHSILDNLLSNACKFTERGEISFRVHKVIRPDASWIQFDVEDTGIGIDPQVLPRLFETFTQADQSSTRRYEGTGLGLAIARRFADLVGAEIAVTSRLGEGSTFTLRVPVDGERQLASTSRMGDRGRG